MSRLLCADMSRIFRAKNFYLGMLGSALLAVVFVILNREDNIFASIPESAALLILPIFLGSVIALNISTEFTSGAIRNKLIIGHSRLNILLSWSVCFVLAALAFFAVYEAAAFFAAAAFSYDLSELQAGIVIKNLAVVLVLILSNLFMSLLVCVIVEDVRSVAVLFLLQFSMMLLATVGGDAFADNEAVRLIFRFFPQGQMTFLSILTEPDKPVLTACCAAGAGLVMLVLAALYFRKHDMK